MTDDTTLLPPVRLIHERLTSNQRERARLRVLLRLALEAADGQQRHDHKTSVPEAKGPFRRHS